MELKIMNDYKDPSLRKIEIVERKGMGHPDTLADKLAEECSRVYSKYCLENFGCILHHNIDKLYIGAGLFLLEEGKIVRHNPIKVVINGRVSNTMNGKNIDLDSLFIPVIKKYLSTVMPRINPDEDLNIIVNCTQFSKREYWYNPRDISDIPDAQDLFAADTSLCVCHGTKTIAERLAFELEQSFWNYKEGCYPSPKYNDIAQDIKVMVSRIDKDISVTICMPVYKDVYKTEEEYIAIVKKHEKRLNNLAKTIVGNLDFNVKVDINTIDDGYRNYSLVKGSCIECGEEGVVGRGNNAQGLISTFREHTVEAPCGKNERYHTGRVINFMGNKAVKRINDELGVKCTLYALTRNRGSITRPYLFYLSVDDLSKETECRNIVNEEFNKDFITEIVKPSKLF
jgi:S-adenosylmethionine synthetase